MQNGFYACEGPGLHPRAVQLLCERDILFHIFIEPFGVVFHRVSECVRSQHLKNDTVAVTAFHNIVCDNTGNSVYERGLCKLPFAFYLIKAHHGSVDLHDLIIVKPVDRAVAALAYYLAAVNAYLPEPF